jgi:uncharacterized protein involved in response to NO
MAFVFMLRFLSAYTDHTGTQGAYKWHYSNLLFGIQNETLELGMRG